MGLLHDFARSGPTFSTILRELRSAATRRFLRRGRARLKLGVDIRPFYEPLTGVGWYLYYLLHELAKHDDVELVLFGDARVTDDGPRFHADVPEKARVSVFDLRSKPLSRLSRPMTAGAYLPLIELEACDLIFGANYFLPRLMSAMARKRVVTIHDLTFKRFPELLQKETLDNLNREMQREIARAEAMICVSNATRDDLLEFYEVDPRRVYAIHSGTTFVRSQNPQPFSGELPRRFILFVSTIEPRKDLDTLIDAFEKLRDTDAYDGDLVVVGKIGWKSDATVAKMRTSRWRDSIRHLDYVSRDQLESVYRAADVFVMPSLYEGFGFPILEAMAYGVPVIASRSSSLPEVGGDAALYFTVRSSDELAARIREITHDSKTRAELILRGSKRIEAFRWERTAEETLAVFRKVAGS